MVQAIDRQSCWAAPGASAAPTSRAGLLPAFSVLVLSPGAPSCCFPVPRLQVLNFEQTCAEVVILGKDSATACGFSSSALSLGWKPALKARFACCERTRKNVCTSF